MVFGPETEDKILTGGKLYLSLSCLETTEIIQYGFRRFPLDSVSKTEIKFT